MRAIAGPRLLSGGRALGTRDEVFRLLISARKRMRVPSKELAQRMGVAPSAVSRWEQRGRQPTFEQIQRYASALGLEVRLVVLAEDGIGRFHPSQFGDD